MNNNTQLTRAQRKLVNVALFRAGADTLGESRTLGDLPRVTRAIAREALGLKAEPAPAKTVRTKVQPTEAAIKEFGYVRALIRANKAA